MFNIRTLVATAGISSLLSFTSIPGAIAYDSGSCYGQSCVGVNPSQTVCVEDAKTIGAMDVSGSGMLELRWSRRCNASWGRFSTYPLYDWTNSLSDTGITDARVTAWNPGEPSQDVAEATFGFFGERTWWTHMVSGETWSCTGVELTAQDSLPGGSMNGFESLGWTWGPCVA